MNEFEIKALEMVIYADGASREQLDAVVKRLRRANELEKEIEAARTRMLKVAEAVDEGQSLMECAEIVELECDSEWEHRVQLEAKVKMLQRSERRWRMRRFPIMGGPSIPWEIIAPHNAQAIANHDQNLERLAERGGLSPLEAICVLEDRKWRRGEMTEANVEAARVKLGELVLVWEDRHLEVENREMRQLCEQADQLNERARKQVEELTDQVMKLAADNARYRVACSDLERKVDLSLLPYEAREAVRQCVFATWTDEERARPPEKCPDCHDGGACLPGGCGVEGCERCGKQCPTCGGSCEVKTGRKTS